MLVNNRSDHVLLDFCFHTLKPEYPIIVICIFLFVDKYKCIYLEVDATDAYDCMLTTTYIINLIYIYLLVMEDNEYLKQFAQRVRKLRDSQGISQEKLAERAGLHRTYIGMVERLERNPSLVCVYKIANGLGIDIKELL